MKQVMSISVEGIKNMKKDRSYKKDRSNKKALITMDVTRKSEVDKKKGCKETVRISTLSNPLLARELARHLDTDLMIVLKSNQLNILNQVFRPIMVGRLVKVTDEFAKFETVNIRMNQAPEFIFPTPLLIPLHQIAWYTPFDPDVRISLY